ncbi:MAG: M50 family metallopeptidase [Bacteroidales bacterium]|nr:M50 family metallopeptidase [Bacteroidales bacterium]
MKNKLIAALFIVVIYLAIKYLFPPFMIVMYPVVLLVTFLHEFGHAFFAVITGGSVDAIQINANGGGFAMISGGFAPLVLLGGYVGSAIFGNLLFYIGVKMPRSSVGMLLFLSLIMIFVSLYWFNSLFTTALLFFFAFIFIFIAVKKPTISSYLLMILGLLSVIYILEDYKVGPSSDIHKFSQIFVFIPEQIWMFVFLFIVLFITYLNIKTIIRQSGGDKS